MDIKNIKFFGREDVLPTAPKKYAETAKIEAKNTKQKLVLLGIALSAALFVFAVGCLIVPMSELFNVSGVFVMIFRLIVIAALAYAYFWGYEILQAMVLKKLFGIEAGRVNMELRLFYHTSKNCFSPKAFFTVKLMPTLMIFVVLLLLNIILPNSLFWVVYITQIINLSCAAPYYCLAAILIKAKPKKVLICEKEDCISILCADK